MGSIERELAATRRDVWEWLVAADRYPDWLLGAQEVRVPPVWPAPGSRFRHRIGGGPLRIPGSTTARETEEPVRFVMTAGMGPLGEAEVTFELRDVEPGRTAVAMTEVPQKGLVAFAHRLAQPVVDRLIDARNAASLQRLEELIHAPLRTSWIRGVGDSGSVG